MPQTNAFSTLLSSYGPSLYWPLDAVDGATDQSGNARNGTGAGGVSIGGYADGPPIIGASDTSTDFNGPAGGNYIDSGWDPFTASTITLCGWAYRDAVSGEQHMWRGSAALGPRFSGDGGDTDIWFEPESTYYKVTWAGRPAGEWFFWGFVFRPGGPTASLYLNGSLVSTQAVGGGYGTSGNFQLGENLGNWNWDGKQAHIAVIEGELTAAQISDLYDAAILGYVPIREYRPSLIHAAGRGQ